MFKWHFGWSRNIAIGVLWTKTGRVGILFLGLSIVRGPVNEVD